MNYERAILLCGCCLSFGAAFANASLFLQTGASVSHLTGDMTRLSIDIVQNFPKIFLEIMVVFIAAISFVIGAFIAGYYIHHPTLDFSQPYARAITFVGLLFLLSYSAVAEYPSLGIALAAMGCGLQNALATRYRGIILRTTHLTGLITDIGVTLGMRVRGLDIPIWKIAVPTFLTASFFVGGICASCIFFLTPYDPLLMAGIAYLICGTLWIALKNCAGPVFSRWLDRDAGNAVARPDSSPGSWQDNR